VKFGANCATSLLARRVEVALRSPVMVSAHEACVGLWFAGARRFLGPQKLLSPAGALGFLDQVGDSLGRYARICPTPAVHSTVSKTCIGRVDLVEPAMTLCVSASGWSSSLAQAASSPRQAAASIAVSTATAPPAASATSAAAAATAAAAPAAPAAAAAAATATAATAAAR
jgi:hypothetical protein